MMTEETPKEPREERPKDPGVPLIERVLRDDEVELDDTDPEQPAVKPKEEKK